MKKLTACIFLLIVTIIWGSGFAISKGTVAIVSPVELIAVRFSIAGLIMFPFLFKRIKKASKNTIFIGIAAGVFVFFAYFFQNSGMKYVTTGESSFISAIYVVIVPFLVWMMKGSKPTIYNIVASIICIVGIGIISLNTGLTMGIGVVLTLICGVFFALQIACISRFARNGDVFVITWLSIVVTAAGGYISAVVMKIPFQPLTMDGFGAILYLAAVCTAFAFIMQYVSMQYAPSGLATIILSMESVFGCLFGVIIHGESVGFNMIIGCALVFAAILLCSYNGKRN